MSDEVVRAKAAVIDRCLVRVRNTWGANPARLADQDVEDVLVLNLQRACEACISMAMHVVARKRLGLPQESKEAFAMLEQAGVLDPELGQRMKDMVGFRNVVVHEYQKLDRAVLRRILEERLPDFEMFCRAVGRHV